MKIRCMIDSSTRPDGQSERRVNANKPPASLALDQLGIEHRIFLHEGSVTSFEQAARERGQRPEQVVRSILFQVRPEEFVMVLMAGPPCLPDAAWERCE